MSEDQGNPSEQLVVYCRSWCGDCIRAFRWLDAREIDYVTRDVEDDTQAREFAESVNAGRLHTPTFTFGEATCVDFDTVWLCDVLGVE